MDNTIQEEDIYRALVYSKKLKEDLLVLLSQRNNEFSLCKNQCLDKIQKENKDIDTLNKIKEQCNVNIARNNARLQLIPREIESLKDDIEYCKSAISNTDTPVYRFYYDDFTGSSYREIDYEATREAEDFIRSMERQIESDERNIQKLQQEAEKRKGFIESLKRMIESIESTIDKKQQLIQKLNDCVKDLEEKIHALVSAITKSTTALDKLSGDLKYAQELINRFGNYVAKTHYKNTINAYSKSMVFLATSNGLTQEISVFKNGSSANMALLQQMTSITKTFSSMLQDNVSEQATSVVNDAIKLQIECYESIDSNTVNLTHANECLCRYEQINF